jgi:hypothetical protein
MITTSYKEAKDAETKSKKKKKKKTKSVDPSDETFYFKPEDEIYVKV